MRYNLGYLDKYPFESAGSSLENGPMYRVFFKRPIDPIRLEEAARKAITAFPLFGTQLEFDREYYLRTNNRPPVIERYTEENRPKVYGKTTNGYPWRIIYDNCTLCFEWMHGVTDGMGAIMFLKQVLLCYFGAEPQTKSLNYLVAPGLEPFVDKKEKGVDYSVDPEGFPARAFPIKYKDYRTDVHLLHGDTAEIVALARKCKSSVVPVLVVLFSLALRMHLPKNLKNRNVACNIAIDVRRSMNYQTMHNCVDLKRITYTDEYDKMSFTAVASIYKEILNKARLQQNAVRSLTERVTLFKCYHLFPSRKWLKFCAKIIGFLYKNKDCNFGLTYLGKIDFPPEVLDQLEDFDFRLWPDFGHCTIGAVDFDGQFNLSVAESFAEKGVVEDFIKLSAKIGLHWEDCGTTVFEQSHFEEEI